MATSVELKGSTQRVRDACTSLFRGHLYHGYQFGAKRIHQIHTSSYIKVKRTHVPAELKGYIEVFIRLGILLHSLQISGIFVDTHLTFTKQAAELSNQFLLNRIVCPKSKSIEILTQ